MIIFSLAFLLGDVILQSRTVLPTAGVLLLLACVSVVFLVLSRRYQCLMIALSGLLMGFVWTGWHAERALSFVLPREWEGKTLVAQGIVDSLPVVDRFGTHFVFALHSLKNQSLTIKRSSKIRLTWRQADSLRVGDEYELSVHLKRIHGMRNPGGFDYEAWALQNGIRASGSVITHGHYQWLGHHLFHAPINQVRQRLQQRINDHLPDSKTAPWLMALMIGERASAPPEHWNILRATGTNHLMAIAGLHIGLISGFVYTFVRFIWRCSRRLTAIYPVPLAASISALGSAWTYSMLAGFSIPTQRACMMVTFFLFALLARRQLPAWHAWSAALWVVMMMDPLVVLSDSFWLSFGTLALIAFGMHGRLRPNGWWWKWGRVQWVIGFGLTPLSLLFFQETSLVSVVANCVAIPWLGFFVLPFCLFSTLSLFIFPSLGGGLLWVADKSLAGLWWLLEWFAHLDFSVWHAAITSPVVFMSCAVGCLLLLLPSGVPLRWLGLLWLLPVIVQRPDVPAHGEYWVTILDVGQGLSVVVQTKTHTLVYDTGPKFGSQFDMGESVVLPYLRASGIKQIDTMIISHGDNDHIGGSAAIMSAIPVTTVLTSAVEKIQSHHAELCLAGMHWQWDGIDFQMLYPFSQTITLNNDSSCVMKISNGYHRLLLTGDIEKFAEKQLISHAMSALPSDIMTAPHHGSKTSSQRAFIQAVMPQYVIYATGYRNRYHFPHQVVVDRYQQAGVFQVNTTEAGAIQFKIGSQSRVNEPGQYRLETKRYWHD